MQMCTQKKLDAAKQWCLVIAWKLRLNIPFWSTLPTVHSLGVKQGQNAGRWDAQASAVHLSVSCGHAPVHCLRTQCVLETLLQQASCVKQIPWQDSGNVPGASPFCKLMGPATPIAWRESKALMQAAA